MSACVRACMRGWVACVPVMAKVVFEDPQQGVSEVAQGRAVLLDALQVVEQGLGREAYLEVGKQGPRHVTATPGKCSVARR